MRNPRAGIVQSSPGLSSFHFILFRGPSAYYIKTYWEDLPDERKDLPGEKEDLPDDREKLPSESEEIPLESEILPDVEPEYLDNKGFQACQQSSNYSLTPYQQPTKVVGRVVDNMIPHEKQPTRLQAQSAIVQQDEETEMLLVAAPEASTSLSSGSKSEAVSTALDFLADIASAALAGENTLPKAKVTVSAGDVEAICEQISVQRGYWVTQVQKEQMMQMNLNQVQKVLETFGQLLTKRSAHSKSMRFDHALRVGQYSPS